MIPDKRSISNLEYIRVGLVSIDLVLISRLYLLNLSFPNLEVVEETQPSRPNQTDLQVGLGALGVRVQEGDRQEVMAQQGVVHRSQSCKIDRCPENCKIQGSSMLTPMH